MKNKNMVISIIVLILVALGLGGYIAYDKLINNDEPKINKNVDKENESESIGNFKLSDDYKYVLDVTYLKDSTYKLNDDFTIKVDKNKNVYVNNKMIDSNYYIYPAFCEEHSDQDYCTIDAYIVGKTLILHNSNFTDIRSEKLYFVDTKGNVYNTVYEFEKDLVLYDYSIASDVLTVKANRYTHGPTALLPNESITYVDNEEYLNENDEIVKSFDEILQKNNITKDYVTKKEYIYELDENGKLKTKPTEKVLETIKDVYDSWSSKKYIIYYGIGY